MTITQRSPRDASSRVTAGQSLRAFASDLHSRRRSFSFRRVVVKHCSPKRRHPFPDCRRTRYTEIAVRHAGRRGRRRRRRRRRSFDLGPWGNVEIRTPYTRSIHQAGRVAHMHHLHSVARIWPYNWMHRARWTPSPPSVSIMDQQPRGSRFIAPAFAVLLAPSLISLLLHPPALASPIQFYVTRVLCGTVCGSSRYRQHAATLLIDRVINDCVYQLSLSVYPLQFIYLLGHLYRDTDKRS